MSKARPHVAEEVIPNPGDLVQSLRDFGYTLPSALADLIDNSLTAGAKRVEITVDAAGESPYIAVLDDGSGMARQTLVEAMRMGTQGPATERSAGDLGRFGLGMKTASLSQGRCLTVISKTSRRCTPVIRRWDITYIQDRHRWQLLDECTCVARQFLDRIREMESGTAVVIEDLDRATFLKVNSIERNDHLGRTLEVVRGHLAMVFHRFIEDGVRIVLGPTPVTPWDPFLAGRSVKLPGEKLRIGRRIVEVEPFVLPHHSKLTDEEHADAGGPLGWNAHQGFYIYRCRRLIVPGTWLNLNLRKEEHFKLARIRVDLPNSVDEDWQLNVMKSHVAAPAFLRDEFRRIANDVRREAANVYRYRGEKVAPTNSSPQRFLWKREERRTGIRYRIDQTHPVVQALLHEGCGHDRLLKQLIGLLERTIPIASMLQEPGRTLDGSVESENAAQLDAYAEMVRHAELFLVRTGKAPAEARRLVLSADPFVRFREELIERLSNTSATGRGVTG